MASVLGLSLRASAPCFERGFAALCAREAKAAMAGVFGGSRDISMFSPVRRHAASSRRPSIYGGADRSVGLVRAFEINKIVRDAGFIPQGPPWREGTTYALRAVDHREVLMRVVLDARRGTAINNIGHIIKLMMKHTSPELTESVQYSLPFAFIELLRDKMKRQQV
jgi:hypothetical protein